MKKFMTETALLFVAITLFYSAYFLTEKMFGSSGKTAFVILAAIGTAIYLYLRWRSEKNIS